MKFRPIEINDYENASAIMYSGGIENCEHCFPTMLEWSFRHDIQIAIEEETVFMRSKGKKHMWYLFPRGAMDRKKATDMILSDAEQQGMPVSIYGIDEENALFLQENYGHILNVTEERDGADYIYRTSDLATLPGKNYQKKRNHISRFVRENPDYKFTVITPDNIHRAKKFQTDWNGKYNTEDSWDLHSEQNGIFRLLDNFTTLKLKGAMIETNGEIVAMTIAAPINERMVDIMVEKAYHEINGAYAIINRDFALNCLAQFEFINREDDMGLENLRKAKLSYFPYEIRKKYLAQSR